VAKTRGDGYVLPRTRHPMMSLWSFIGERNRSCTSSDTKSI